MLLCSNLSILAAILEAIGKNFQKPVWVKHFQIRVPCMQPLHWMA